MPQAQIGPPASLGQFVGESLTNGGPVLTDGLAGQHPPRTPLELLAPEVANYGRVISDRRIEAGQKFGRHVGSIFVGQRKRLSQKSLSLVSHDSSVQRQQIEIRRNGVRSAAVG